MNFKIDENNVGIRIDKYLKNKIKDISRSQIEKTIEDGQVLVNSKKVKPSYLTKINDEITFEKKEVDNINYIDFSDKIKIIYQDKNLLVINKSRGIVVHPAIGHHGDTLVDFLKANVSNLSNINGENRLGIVHRIDKDTSGLLLVAKNNQMHEYLANQLKNHEIKREYIAIVKGIIREDNGLIDAPITRDPKNRLKYTVGDKNAKEAITHFVVLKRLKKHTVVKLSLETGRTHQIRVHMKFIGHPVEGDPLYCDNYIDFNGQLLHAFKISFDYPYKGKMEFETEIPEYFKKAIEVLS